MIVVIIAGGSGTRLWPRSTPTRPKQFMVVDDTGRSLIQKTYDRVRNVSKAVYVVTSAPIADMTVEHLPQLKDSIVVESARKGVANALYLGLRKIKNDGYGETEPIFVVWSDHLIHDTKTFIDTIETAEESVISGRSKLVQFGIVPEYPSNQLGYIKKGKRLHDNIFELESFKYQPDQETANEWYVSGDYLWNSGYFVSTPEFVMGEIRRESPGSYSEYEAIMKASDSRIDAIYGAQQGGVLDNVFSEKMKGAHAVACTFDWIDIGNYQDLHSISKKDADGNYIDGKVFLSEGGSHNYVHNELDVPIAVVGLDNISVVATPDGIVVANTSQSKKVGDVAKKIQG